MLMQLLCQKRSRSKNDEALLKTLQHRARFLQSVFIIIRLCHYIFKTGRWYRFDQEPMCYDNENNSNSKCLWDYNKTVLDPFIYEKQVLLLILCILNAVLCIMSYKWLYLANSFIYIECVIRITGDMIPNSLSQNETAISMIMNLTAYFTGFYCDSKGHIFVMFFTMVWHSMFTL